MDSPSASSTLYCAEDAASWAEDDVPEWSPPPAVLPDGPPVAALLAAEADHLPLPDYLPRLLDRSLDPTARQDAVNWIHKIHDFYCFRPVTAYLAVNYLDRFLSSATLPAGGAGWAMQLLSVACVSVAAKMEETRVPLLLDLQILDPRYVFEPRTVRRMELHLMAALRWRMRAVTPFDYLSASRGGGGALPRAAVLVLASHRVVEFLSYRPSAIAAAALRCCASDGDDAAGVEEWASEDVVSGCRQLMEDYLIDTCPHARGAKRGAAAAAAPPRSPVGVLDAAACGSCDTVKSGAEPASKRSRPMYS